MDADAHVDRLVPVFVELSDGRDHGQAHLDAVLGVVGLRLGAAFIKRGHIQLSFSWLQIEMIFSPFLALISAFAHRWRS